MLTKDLIRYHIRGKQLKPDFIDPEDAELQHLARAFVDLYQSLTGKSRVDVEEHSLALIKQSGNSHTARGFNKLMQDSCVFEQTEISDYTAFREQVFMRSSTMILNGELSTVEAYRAQFDGRAHSKLYADLPHNDILDYVKLKHSPDLLNRYNMALVQGLLLGASSIKIYTEDQDQARLRRLFKFLKFFRLRALIKQKGKGIHIEIDGPLSILDSSRKYGLQLAVFFPAVCQLTHWQLSTEVQTKRSVRKLKLSHESGLVSHYRNFSAYIPSEIKIFASQFKEKSSDWTMLSERPFLHINDEIFFPDFVLEHLDGRKVYLELFHRWHYGPLIQRLAAVDSIDLPLIIGIDRFLYKGDVKKILDNKSDDALNYFLFNDFPTVTKLKKCLKSS